MITLFSDILSINETRLDDSISDDEVYIPGYDIIRRDRDHNGRFGGGICIYVRSNINFSLRPDLSDIHLENLCIEIRKPRSNLYLLLPGIGLLIHQPRYFLILNPLLASLMQRTLSFI